jgi:hypothetical protein
MRVGQIDTWNTEARMRNFLPHLDDSATRDARLLVEAAVEPHGTEYHPRAIAFLEL